MFDGMEVTVGMSFRATTDDGEQSVIVIDVTEDEIVVDGNHPLAGVDLTFDVEILEVRSASEKEIAEGKVCETGCCH
jgi:FKBP-type peptidyl-prolyl cis-trans isomerase SlyD